VRGAAKEMAIARQGVMMKQPPYLLAAATIMTIVTIVPGRSEPPTAEIAKECRDLAIKAHPRTLPGAGHGSAKAQRDYFQDCVSKKQQPRKMPGQPPR
jgi:hypothetical protein